MSQFGIDWVSALLFTNSFVMFTALFDVLEYSLKQVKTFDWKTASTPLSRHPRRSATPRSRWNTPTIGDKSPESCRTPPSSTASPRKPASNTATRKRPCYTSTLSRTATWWGYRQTASTRSGSLKQYLRLPTNGIKSECAHSRVGLTR